MSPYELFVKSSRVLHLFSLFKDQFLVPTQSNIKEYSVDAMQLTWMGMVKVLRNHRGNVVVIVSNYKLSRHRNLKDELVSFKCCNTKCSVLLSTNRDYSHAISQKNEHNHVPMTDQEFERAAIQSSLRRKAVNNLCAKPNKLIRKELQVTSSSSLEHSDMKLIRKSLYEARRKVTPTLPKNKPECFWQFSVQSIRIDRSPDTLRCFMSSQNNFPVFTIAANLLL